MSSTEPPVVLDQDTTTAPRIALPIDYATLTAEEDRTYHLLRRIVGGTAAVLGGAPVVISALHIALAAGWIAGPSGMRYGGMEGALEITILAGRLLTSLTLAIGGVLLLWRASNVSIWIIRIGAVAVIAVSILNWIEVMMFDTYSRSVLSNPAYAAAWTLSTLAQLVPDVLILLLLLPTFAKRMTRA